MIMSAKLKLFFILTFSIFATVAAGTYINHSQLAGTANGQQQQFLLQPQSPEILAYPGRYHYQTIPLDGINSILHGSDPTNLALNALDDMVSVSGKRKIEVAYPQPNQALVTITQIKSVGNISGNAIKYRIEMKTFGRSLLVSSPPVWQIIWAGSQVQSSPHTKLQQFSTK